MSKSINLAALQDNPAALQALLAILGGKGRKTRSDKGFTKSLVAEAMTVDQKKAALDAATIAAFAKLGLTVTPRVDVLVYGRVKDDGSKTGWLAKGMKPKAGSKAVFVKAKGMHGKGIPLFHSSQCEPIATETAQSAS